MHDVPIEHIAPSELITTSRVETTMMLFPTTMLEHIARNEADIQEFVDLRNAMIDNGFRAAACHERSVGEDERKKYAAYAQVFFDARRVLRDKVLELGKIKIDVNVK